MKADSLLVQRFDDIDQVLVDLRNIKMCSRKSFEGEISNRDVNSPGVTFLCRNFYLLKRRYLEFGYDVKSQFGKRN